MYTDMYTIFDGNPRASKEEKAQIMAALPKYFQCYGIGLHANKFDEFVLKWKPHVKYTMGFDTPLMRHSLQPRHAIGFMIRLSSNLPS